jgi:hypothetical protein
MIGVATIAAVDTIVRPPSQRRNLRRDERPPGSPDPVSAAVALAAPTAAPASGAPASGLAAASTLTLGSDPTLGSDSIHASRR